jgi:NitT/TauT family transport system ATP-binding protein
MSRTGTSAAAIDVRDVSMQFESRQGTTVALAEVSFIVGATEIVSLVGPSGCGKSTVLNLVAGFARPTDGTITVEGRPVMKPGPDRAMVFQKPALFPWFNVFDNIVFAPKRHGIPAARYRADAERLIAAVGLTGFEKHYPYQLSGGMAQRVSLARALMERPRALLLDEPFGALDAQTRVAMQRLLLQVWDQFRTTILFVTHDVEEAVYLADRVLVMDRRPGRIKAVITVDLARPRALSLVTTPEFSAIRAAILRLIFDGDDVAGAEGGAGASAQPAQSPIHTQEET